MKIAALLLAAGKGERFNSPIPKQFHTLNGKKLYRHTLDLLIKSKLFSTIICVTQKDFLPYFDEDHEIEYITGGSTRMESVFLGLQALNAIDGVMICESVRPFYSMELVKNHIDAFYNGHHAINTCIPSTDTISILEEGKVQSIPKREQFLLGQTPQTFCYQKLISAHKKSQAGYTDDCAIMLENHHDITYLTGCKYNIKITEPNDLILAEVILSKRLSFS